jgi:hypothetical protein
MIERELEDPEPTEGSMYRTGRGREAPNVREEGTVASCWLGVCACVGSPRLTRGEQKVDDMEGTHMNGAARAWSSEDVRIQGVAAAPGASPVAGRTLSLVVPTR